MAPSPGSRRPQYDPKELLVNLQRLPPQARDSEQYVIGCLTLGGDAQGERLKMARETLTALDFFEQRHQEIYKAILKVAEGGAVDLNLVAQELDERGKGDLAGGRAYLLACENGVGMVSMMGRHIGRVRRAAGQRRAIDIGGEVFRLAHDGADPEEIAGYLSESSGDARLHTNAPERLETVTAAQLKERRFEDIRWAVPGLIPEGLTLLVGRSKIGKSFLVHGVAAGIAEEKGIVLSSVPVEGGTALVLFLEDPERRIQSRHRQIATDNSWPERLHFATHARTLDDGLIGMLAEFHDRHSDLRLVVIDTFARARGKVDTTSGVYWAEYETLARLQAFGIRRKIAVCATHHTNKQNGKEDEFDPVSGSTGMQAPCDALLLLGRKRGEDLAELVVTGREIKDEKLALKWHDQSGWTLLGDSEVYFRTTEELDLLGELTNAGMPVTPEHLASVMKIEPAACRQRLCRMRDRTLVRAEGAGYVPTDLGTRALRAAGIAME